jgi:predicted GNAT family acetyltransferase
MQAAPIRLPQTLTPTLTGEAVQMVAEAPFPFDEDPRIEPLAERDAAEMLDLATLTKPGPFTLKAQSLGRFWGIRLDGRLVAMAGERLKQPGLTELSGVCTHPEARGRGLGRSLSLHVMRQIFVAGDRAFLHAWAANTAAIGLYQSIGFELRRPMHVAAAVKT